MDFADQTEVAASLERTIASDVPDSGGLVRIVGMAPGPYGRTDYEVTANRLVSLDPDDEALADVFVAVPVSGHVSIDQDGSANAQLDPVDESTSNEVRAWARTLIASGSVAGIAAAGPRFGPPQRPTHELVEDDSDRRILRRIGFAAF